MKSSYKACLTFFIFLVLIPSSAYGQLDAHISVGQLPPPARIGELVVIYLHVTNIGAVTITDITVNNITIEPPVCFLYLAIPLVTTLLNPGETLRYVYECIIESDDTVNVKITASASGKSPSTVNSNEASGFFDLKGYGDFLESITISDTITTSVHRVVSLEENLTFSDSISIHLSKTLTETLSISDSLKAEKKRIVTCANFSQDDVIKPNDPQCMLWPGYGSKDAKVFVQIANGPLTLINTVCNADDLATVTAQLAGTGECVFDDGIDVIVWSTVFNDSVFTIILPEPEPKPQPVSQSNGKSGGGGRINLDVSSHTSLDRLATWLSTPEHFKVALHNLIQQDIVDLEVSQIRDPPEWFYTTVEFWSTEQIDDQEFFNALEFILKN